MTPKTARKQAPYKHFAWFVLFNCRCQRQEWGDTARTCTELPGRNKLCPFCLAKQWFRKPIAPEKEWLR